MRCFLRLFFPLVLRLFLRVLRDFLPRLRRVLRLPPTFGGLSYWESEPACVMAVKFCFIPALASSLLPPVAGA